MKLTFRKRCIIKTDLSEPPVEQIESEKEQCLPMRQEGTYTLKDGSMGRRRHVTK